MSEENGPHLTLVPPLEGEPSHGSHEPADDGVSFEQAAQQAVDMNRGNAEAAFQRRVNEAAANLEAQRRHIRKVTREGMRDAVILGTSVASAVVLGDLAGKALDHDIAYRQDQYEQQQEQIRDGERDAFEQGMIDGRVEIKVPDAGKETGPDAPA